MTGRKWGDVRKQNIMLKKMISSTEIPFTANPALPIQNGPLGTFFRPVKRCGPIASAYEVVVRIMKEPTRSKNAVLEPSWMAPKAVQRIAIGIWFSYLQMARGGSRAKGVAHHREPSPEQDNLVVR